MFGYLLLAWCPLVWCLASACFDLVCAVGGYVCLGFAGRCCVALGLILF